MIIPFDDWFDLEGQENLEHHLGQLTSEELALFDEEEWLSDQYALWVELNPQAEFNWEDEYNEPEGFETEQISEPEYY